MSLSKFLCSDILYEVVAYVEINSEVRALQVSATLRALGATVVTEIGGLVTHVVWSEGSCFITRLQARNYGANLVYPSWVDACLAESRFVSETDFKVRRLVGVTAPRDVNKILDLIEKVKKSGYTDETSYNGVVACLEEIKYKEEMEERLLTQKMMRQKILQAEKTILRSLMRVIETPDLLNCKSDNTSDPNYHGPNMQPPITVDQQPSSKDKLEISVDAPSSSEDELDETNVIPKSNAVGKSKKKYFRNCSKNRRKAKLARSSFRSTRPITANQDSTVKPDPTTEVEAVNSNGLQDKMDFSKSSDDKNTVTSPETSNESTTTDVESRVNTAPRRALPMSMSITPPELHPRPRRKLFTQREVPSAADSTDSDEEPVASTSKRPTLCHKRGLQRAERLAQKYMSSFAPRSPSPPPAQPWIRIVLTGMSSEERQRVSHACLALKGKTHPRVTRKTTHVVVGNFGREDNPDAGVANPIMNQENFAPENMRTLNAILGAARGCRVVRAQWVLDSLEVGNWLPHYVYEIPLFKKTSQRAYLERHAFGLMNSDYGYDIFNGKRIRISSSVEQSDGAIQVLALCKAVVYDKDGRIIHNAELLEKHAQNGGHSQHGAYSNARHGGHAIEYDFVIGTREGEVNTAWVFDSVIASRMKCTRSYKMPRG